MSDLEDTDFEIVFEVKFFLNIHDLKSKSFEDKDIQECLL